MKIVKRIPQQLYHSCTPPNVASIDYRGFIEKTLGAGSPRFSTKFGHHYKPYETYNMVH